MTPEMKEIALRVAGEMPCCCNHVDVSEGVCWSQSREVKGYMHDDEGGAGVTQNAGGNATERSEGRVDHNVGRYGKEQKC